MMRHHGNGCQFDFDESGEIAVERGEDGDCAASLGFPLSAGDLSRVGALKRLDLVACDRHIIIIHGAGSTKIMSDAAVCDVGSGFVGVRVRV